MSLFVVGDSHSTFFEQSGIMKSHWTGPIHIATIFQLLERGLNLYRLKEDLATSEHYIKVGGAPWQFPEGKYVTPNIVENDSVIFCYGFNDMQKNIYKYAAKSYDIEIYRLCDLYVKLIKSYEAKFKIRGIICSIPPNPLPKIEGAVGNYLYGLYGDFHTEGTVEERLIYNLYANKTLSELCDKYGITFLNLYDKISDNGFIKKEYTTDHVHLQWDNVELIKDIKDIIENKLT